MQHMINVLLKIILKSQIIPFFSAFRNTKHEKELLMLRKSKIITWNIHKI